LARLSKKNSTKFAFDEMQRQLGQSSRAQIQNRDFLTQSSELIDHSPEISVKQHLTSFKLANCHHIHSWPDKVKAKLSLKHLAIELEEQYPQKSDYIELIILIINHLQIMSIALQYDYEWPGLLGNMLMFSKLSTSIVSSAVNSQCLWDSISTLPFAYGTSIVTLMVVPVLIVILSSMFIYNMYMCSIKNAENRVSVFDQTTVETDNNVQITTRSVFSHRKTLTKQDIAKHSHDFFSSHYYSLWQMTMFMSFNLLYPNLVQACISLFVCRPVASRSVLLADTSIDCNSDIHRNWQLLMILFIIIWAIGITVFFLYRMCSHHELWTYIPNVDNYDADKVARKAELHLSIGFLGQGFRPEKYYWNTIKMFEKVLLVIVVVLFPGNIQLQLIAGLIISATFCFLQVQFKPMSNDTLNLIETASLLSSCLLFTFGLFFFAPECSNNSACKQSISVIIALSIIIFLAICLWAFINEILVKLKSHSIWQPFAQPNAILRMPSNHHHSLNDAVQNEHTVVTRSLDQQEVVLHENVVVDLPQPSKLKTYYIVTSNTELPENQSVAMRLVQTPEASPPANLMRIYDDISIMFDKQTEQVFDPTPIPEKGVAESMS
jgi:glycosyltransferase involved in cell wall biosynthesis